jgi:hypothetical protein
MCPIDDFKLDAKSEYQWWCLSLGHPVGSGFTYHSYIIHALKRTGGKKGLRRFVSVVVKQQLLQLN